MKRFAAVVVACSFVCSGFMNEAFSADAGYCPPGAKFCPMPGSGVASAPPSSAPRSHFENQLNDGEQLIMVAPNEQNGMIITPNPDAYAYADSGYSAPSYDSYSSPAYSSSSSPTYSSEPYTLDSQTSSPVYSSEPYYANNGSFSSHGGFASGGFSSQPYAADYSDDFSDGGSSPFGGGFVPPPPGSGSGSSGGYSSEPAPSFASRSVSSAPARTLYEEDFDSMDDFDGGSAAAQRSSGRNYREKAAGGPPPSSAVDGYDRVSGDRRSVSYDGRDYEVSNGRVDRNRGSDSIPSREDVSKARGKKKRADILSEVANETSQKSYSSGGRAAPARRVPWWKGGLWRNRKADRAAREAQNR